MKLFEVTQPIDGEVTPGIWIDPANAPIGIKIGRDETQTILELGVSQRKQLEHAMEIGYWPTATPIPLVRADVTDEEKRRLRREKNPRDSRALVYVEVPTVHGEVEFRANSYDEEWCTKERRVRRIFRPFEAMVGVEVVAMSQIENDGAKWPDALLIMQPGASFRIHRTGRLEGEVPEFLISWNGRELRSIIPNRYRREPSTN